MHVLLTRAEAMPPEYARDMDRRRMATDVGSSVEFTRLHRRIHTYPVSASWNLPESAFELQRE